MTRVYLNQEVAVKDNGETALALRLNVGDYFHFSGDVAKLVVILYLEHADKDRAVDLEKVRKRLAGASESFAKNRSQKRCIREVVQYLKRNGLLHEDAKI